MNTPLDLAQFDAPIEPIILSHIPIQDDGRFQVDEHGQPVVVRITHTVRPIDAVGYQLLGKLAEHKDDIGLYRQLVARILPTASPLEMDQMSLFQMMAQHRLANLLDALGKDMGTTTVVPTPAK